MHCKNKNTNDKIITTQNAIPEAKKCLKELEISILKAVLIRDIYK